MGAVVKCGVGERKVSGVGPGGKVGRGPSGDERGWLAGWQGGAVVVDRKP